MPDHTEVYNNQAEQYERLISREDYQLNITRTLKKIRNFDQLDIIDMGAGTGRLTCLLAPQAQSIIALDSSQPMLDITAQKLENAGLINWRIKVADHRALPLEDKSADIIVAGWSICYLGSSNVDGWEQNIHKVIAEMKRVLRPGGTIIILETLGTGFEESTPPSYLKGYYSLLENEYELSHTSIRTDYKFNTVQEAEQLTRFFFGDELADKVVQDKQTILPECTGIWWLHTERMGDE
jgi:ubiquinone/menaquinone biosynthesis C-methylase UbiE